MAGSNDDEHTAAAARSCHGSATEQPKSTSWTQRLGRPPKWAVLILILVVALGAVATIQRIRSTTPPPGPVLVAQFAEWMSANTKSNIQISRVSCLDPAAAGALATCQFTATLDPHGPTTTYFHDFKCTAELDLAGSVTNVERPDSIAWILSEHITQ